MGIFNAKRPTAVLSPREQLTAKYNTARLNLLVAVIATAVNVLLCITNTNYYFLFSACIPYVIASMSMYLCGKYSADFYDETFTAVKNPLSDGFFIGAIIVAVIIIGLYLLCYFMSKKHIGFMIAALVLFSLDTAFMLFWFGIDFSMILDYVFHAWVLYYLISSVVSYSKLKNMPEVEEVPVEEAVITEE